MTLTPEEVFRALDGPRRAGWAKYYEAADELDTTERQLADLKFQRLSLVGALHEAIGYVDSSGQFVHRAADWAEVFIKAHRRAGLYPVPRELLEKSTGYPAERMSAVLADSRFAVSEAGDVSLVEAAET